MHYSQAASHTLQAGSNVRHLPCRSDEIEPEGMCPQNLELRWMSEVASSVYATPLITDLFSDGHKDIVVPSFVHHLDVRSLHAHEVMFAAVAQCYQPSRSL